MAIRKAKTLNADQFDGLIRYLGDTKNGSRDRVMFMLSFKCGLRSCEIARLRWRDVIDARGVILPVGAPIELGHHITKGRKPDTFIYMHSKLRESLVTLKRIKDPLVDDHLMHASHRDVRNMSPNNVTVYLHRLYKKAGLFGCSSHSGRRTFITNLARTCNTHNASIMDVKTLARHADIRTTEKYIDLSQNTINLALDA